MACRGGAGRDRREAREQAGGPAHRRCILHPYNAGCGEGYARQFVAAPNANGQLPGPPLPAVHTSADFRALNLRLNPAQVNALAAFYNIHAPTGVARKEQLKHALGLSFP